MICAYSLLKLARFCAVGLLIGSGVTSAYAQQKVLSRATPEQLTDLLKKDPTLSSGFTTSGRKAAVHVVKLVKGGMLLRYESGNISGTATVIGPLTTLDRNALGDIIDGIINYAVKFLSGFAKCSTTTTTTTSTTTTNGKTTTTYTTTTSTTCQAG
jgi:hypothetical protein